tara:strand:+ start:114 stop:992 length:879 start_codon:yes stop_codon:yes gene_type:complete
MKRFLLPTFKHCRVTFFAAIFICASLIISPASAELSPKSHESRDLLDIIDDGVIRVAMLKTDELPFFYHNADQKLVGIDIDLLELIEKELNIKVELIRTATTFDGVVELVARGEADLALSMLSVTINRAKRISFTRPYALNSFALVVNRVAESRGKKSNKGEDFFNRAEIKLGVQMDSSYESFARRKYPKATLVQIANFSDIANAVAEGQIDAAISAKLSLEPLFKRDTKLNFKLRTVVFYDEPDLMAAVVHPTSHHLLNWMNTFLHINEIVGTMDSIKNQHGVSLKQTNQK